MTEVAMSTDAVANPKRGELVLTAFTGFRSQLDAHTDKRERLIKLSRDITALSKKLIFTLHRLSLASSAPEDRYNECRDKDNDIRLLLAKVGAEFADDEGEFWRYENNVSPGLQEYIEAVSFLYFLSPATSGQLIPLSYLQSTLSDPVTGKAFFPVTPSDYILGLSDLTGELMRFTLNAIGLGRHDEALRCVGFVRDMKAQFDPLISLIPGLYKKQEITNQSLQKIEDAAYQVALRRQEFAGREDVLGEMVKRGLASASAGGGGGQEEEGEGRGGKRARIE